jgi:hypothetical protein
MICRRRPTLIYLKALEVMTSEAADGWLYGAMQRAAPAFGSKVAKTAGSRSCG